MGGVERGRSRAWKKLAPVLAGAAFAAGSQIALTAPSAAESSAIRATDCTRENFGGRLHLFESNDPYTLSSIVQACSDAVRAESSLRQIANANLYRGRAKRRLGEVTGNPQMYEEAIEALRGVLAYRPSRPDPRLEQTQTEATLELAQVYRSQGKFQEAIDILSNQSSPRARFALAQTYIAREPARLGDREAAAQILYSLLSTRDLDDYLNASTVRSQLVEVANKLGREAVAEDTPASLRRAHTAFSLAKSAIADAGDIRALNEVNLKLGQVQMRLAGFKGPDEAGGCARGDGLQDQSVREALQNFNDAGQNDAQANRWAGCALMALGNYAEAVRRFEMADTVSPNDASIRLSLARALALAAREASRRNDPDATSQWRQSLQRFNAAVGLQTDPVSRARIYVEIADVNLDYLQTVSDSGRADVIKAANDALGAAIAALERAPAPTPGQPNTGANLVRADALVRQGMIRAGEGDFEPWADLPAAGRLLEEALRLLPTGTPNRALRAQALYHLSRVDVRRARQANSNDGRAAVRNADAAVALNEDPGLASTYASQACLVRIFFNYVREEHDAARYCTASESREPLSLLYEGMYHLRRTYIVRGGDQAREWESALSAFSDGADRLGAAPLGNEPLQTQELRSRLQVGRGVAQFCIGLQNIGRTTLNSITVLRSESEAFFESYRLRRCAGRQ